MDPYPPFSALKTRVSGISVFGGKRGCFWLLKPERSLPRRGSQLLDQLRQRTQAVRVVNGDVVRGGIEDAVILEVAEGARQDLDSLRSLGMTAVIRTSCALFSTK